MKRRKMIFLHKPPKLLLTSTQVSLLLSAAIILFSAIGIFLAGYALQQHTLSQLHTTLRPRTPTPRHNAHQPNQQDPHHSPLAMTGSVDTPFDWTRFAYAQLVRSHAEACAALVALADLHRARSAAPKVLLFPRAWLAERGGAAPLDAALDASLRLVRKAARRYRAVLVPVEPVDELAAHSGK
jgi:hypothetical protein